VAEAVSAHLRARPTGHCTLNHLCGLIGEAKAQEAQFKERRHSPIEDRLKLKLPQAGSRGRSDDSCLSTGPLNFVPCSSFLLVKLSLNYRGFGELQLGLALAAALS
jgi:hypothetical protein